MIMLATIIVLELRHWDNIVNGLDQSANDAIVATFDAQDIDEHRLLLAVTGTAIGAPQPQAAAWGQSASQASPANA